VDKLLNFKEATNSVRRGVIIKRLMKDTIESHNFTIIQEFYNNALTNKEGTHELATAFCIFSKK